MICPHCLKETDNYTEQKLQSNWMNHYVNAKTGIMHGVFNSNAERLSFKTKEGVLDLVRQDLYKPAPVETAKVADKK